MSTPKKAKTANRKTKSSAQPNPSQLVWFEIPADDMKRAQGFYRAMFGWEISAFPNMPDIVQLDTGGSDDSPNGGMMPRKHEHHRITQYFGVASVTKAVTKAVKLGGKVCVPKTAVPGMGYFAICQDTESNIIGLWEPNPRAK